jgi:hypothetical protein
MLAGVEAGPQTIILQTTKALVEQAAVEMEAKARPHHLPELLELRTPEAVEVVVQTITQRLSTVAQAAPA